MEKDINETRDVELVSVELIGENPFQPRKEFNEDEIKELAESIQTHGLIQPIILRRIGERFQVVAGERRLRATRSLGVPQIASIIMDIDGIDVAEVSLIENIQRKNLNCLEEAEAFGIMKTRFGMSAEDIAKRIGKSRPYVSNTMRMVGLPIEIKKSISENTISMGHGRALLSLDSAEKQKKAHQTVLRDALSVRQTEDLVTKLLAEETAKKGKRRKRIKETLGGDFQSHYEVIKDAVKAIKTTGGKADVIERETDDYFELIIRIAK